jgi:hypothetical protein
MTSIVLRPVERELIALSGLSTNASGARITLARRISVAAYKEVTAYVRLHAGTSVTATLSTGNFNIYADGFTDEDPGALDANSTFPGFQALLLATDIRGAPSTPGTMSKITVPANFGSLLTLDLTIVASVIGTINYVMSVDLICKEF